MIVALTQWIRVSSPLSKVTLYYTHVRSLHYFGRSGGVIPNHGSHYKVASQSVTNLLFVYMHSDTFGGNYGGNYWPKNNGKSMGTDFGSFCNSWLLIWLLNHRWNLNLNCISC